LEPVEASRRFALVFFFRDGFRERGFLAGSDEEEEDRLIHRLLRNDCEGLHEVVSFSESFSLNSLIRPSLYGCSVSH